MVHDQQQSPARPGPGVAPDGLDDLSARGPQPSAGLFARLGDGGAHRVGVESGDVDAGEPVPGAHGAGRQRFQERGAVGRAEDAEPERVVVVQHELQGGHEGFRVGARGRAQHPGLVVAVGGARPFQEPGGDGSRGHLSGALPGRDGGCPAELGGDGRDGLGRAVDEDVARGDAEAGLADPADELDGEDAVTAEREEVVVGADGRGAQHGGEHVAQDAFPCGARPASRPGGRGALGCGQGTPVGLAVGQQRQGVERHVDGGNHVGRQECREPGAQVGVGEVRGPVAPVGDGVGDQSPLAGPVLPDEGAGGGDPVEGGEGGLDLAEFDTEAVQLDLVVGAGDIGEQAVGVPPDEVAGAVHAAPGRAVRIGDEPPGGQAGASQVAACEAVARDVELAGGARRYGPQCGVQDMGAGVVDRASQRHGPLTRGGVGVPGPVVVGGRVDRRLGGPVEVVDLGVPGPSHPFGQRPGQGFAAAEHGPQRRGRLVGPCLGEDDREVRGDELRDGRARVAHPRQQPRGVVVECGRHEAGGTAVQQRQPGLPDGGVEARRRTGEDPVVVGEAQVVRHPRHVVGQGGVGGDDALGAAGGTGGVDDVRRVVRVRHGCGRPRAPGGPGGPVVECEAGHRPVVGRGARGAVGEEQGRTGVLDHVGDTRLGVLQVQRQVRGARLGHRQHRDHLVGGAFQGEGDEVAAADAPAPQVVRQIVGEGVEFGEGEAVRAVQHGDRRRGPRALCAERVGHRACRGRPDAAVRGPFEVAPLGGVQDVHRVDAQAGVGGERGEQPGQPVRQGVRGGGTEEFCGELQYAVEAGRPSRAVVLLGEGEGQVELADAGVHGLLRDREARQVDHRVGVVLEDEHGLEQRVVVLRPDRVEGVHQPLERHVLVGVRRQVELPYPVQDFDEGGISAQIGAQHEGVDEEAHQVVEGLVGAAGDGGAERDVLTGAVP